MRFSSGEKRRAVESIGRDHYGVPSLGRDPLQRRAFQIIVVVNPLTVLGTDRLFGIALEGKLLFSRISRS